MAFNVLRNAIIRNDRSCRLDNNEGFSVVWRENDNFQQYEEFSGLTSRLVWDRRFVAVAVSGTCFIGPNTDQVPFDGGIYHLVNAKFRLEPGFGVALPTTGRIQFQTNDDPVYDSAKSVDFPIISDNVYNEYTIDMSQIKAWQGDITRIRLYPFIDGASGTIIHFKSIKVKASNTFSCSSVEGGICDKFTQFVHPCPSVGAGGSCESTIVSDGINITEGVNDKLIVNINNYGSQGITLTPVKGARLKDIARDIEDKLSNVAIGGYAGVKVEVIASKLLITADDTREASSTVVLEDTPAARTLGFFDNQGNSISVCLSGEEAGSQYSPAGTIQLSKSQISRFYLSEEGAERSGLELNPNSFAVQAGRADFAITYKDKKIDFSDKTIIDFNNPVTNNGTITKVSFSGNGNTSTEFRFFRPKADGSITHFASVSMGISSDGQIDQVFEQSTQIKVRKGDFVGLFDGKVDAGKIEEAPNTSYFMVI
jgi:hypothetical protein